MVALTSLQLPSPQRIDGQPKRKEPYDKGVIRVRRWLLERGVLWTSHFQWQRWWLHLAVCRGCIVRRKLRSRRSSEWKAGAMAWTYRPVKAALHRLQGIWEDSDGKRRLGMPHGRLRPPKYANPAKPAIEQDLPRAWPGSQDLICPYYLVNIPYW